MTFSPVLASDDYSMSKVYFYSFGYADRAAVFENIEFPQNVSSNQKLSCKMVRVMNGFWGGVGSASR